MKLGKEVLEKVAMVALDIDYGKIIINISGPPSNTIDIITEKRHRFKMPKPTKSPAKGPG